MSKPNQETGAESRAAITKIPNSNPPFLFADKHSTPVVSQLFNIAATTHQYLPYDPDVVITQYMRETENTKEGTPTQVADEIEYITGIRLHDMVLERARENSNAEYTNDKYTILRQLVQAHAALLAEQELILTNNDFPRLTHKSNREPQTILALRMITTRALVTSYTYGQTISEFVTQTLQTDNNQVPTKNDKQ